MLSTAENTDEPPGVQLDDRIMRCGAERVFRAYDNDLRQFLERHGGPPESGPARLDPQLQSDPILLCGPVRLRMQSLSAIAEEEAELARQSRVDEEQATAAAVREAEAQRQLAERRRLNDEYRAQERARERAEIALAEQRRAEADRLALRADAVRALDAAAEEEKERQAAAAEAHATAAHLALAVQLQRQNQHIHYCRINGRAPTPESAR